MDMDESAAGNRRKKRVYFPFEHEINGVIDRSGASDEDLAIKILNLSEGGLFFILAKKSSALFQPGETIAVRNISGPGQFVLSDRLILNVRWINDHEALDNIGYGCEFVDLPDQSAMQIRDMMADFLQGYGE